MSNHHEAVHEIRDPIYGFVKLSESEWEIVRCPEFQRLRDIRQLAMGHMVYPGATHTRFEHSIGCLHLVTKMFDALVEKNADLLKDHFQLSAGGTDRARQLVRLAALLHDVGHPPFSHSGEKLLPKVPGSRPRSSADHEMMGGRIIGGGSIAQCIQSKFDPLGINVNEVIAIATDYEHAKGFKPQAFHGWLHELLTSEIGADRIDYLLRDAYHSGQKSGEFDYRRLIDTLTMVEPLKEDGETPRIGFTEGGWLVAEQMIVARYLMYQSLYFHKTKRIYEIHLERYMGEWVKSKKYGYTLPWDISEYSSISDSDVLGDMHTAARDNSAKGHFEAIRFIDRSHMRMAIEIILADNLKPRSKKRLPCKERFAKLRREVSRKFGHNVICDEPDHSATKIFGETNKILVSVDGKVRYLDDISEIVRGMSAKIWRGRVYADSSVRSKVNEWCHKWLNNNSVSKYS